MDATHLTGRIQPLLVVSAQPFKANTHDAQSPDASQSLVNVVVPAALELRCLRWRCESHNSVSPISVVGGVLHSSAPFPFVTNPLFPSVGGY
jgi:hypothetical protein